MPATKRSLLLTGVFMAGALFLGACSSSSSPDPAVASGDDAGTSTTPTEPTKDHSGASDTPAGGSKTCSNAEDCDDTRYQICDPTSHTCVDGQCGATATKQCKDTDVCVYQTSHTGVGACFEKCTPWSTCTGDRECAIGSFDGTTAYCKARGTGAPDALCTKSGVSTACVAGYVCTLDPALRYCREQCDFFGTAKGCSNPSLKCVPPGICSGEPPDPAKPGDPCAATATSGAACAASATRLDGICAPDAKGGAKMICSAWCRMAIPSDCPTGKTCQPTGIPSVGYCQ